MHSQSALRSQALGVSEAKEKIGKKEYYDRDEKGKWSKEANV